MGLLDLLHNKTKFMPFDSPSNKTKPIPSNSLNNKPKIDKPITNSQSFLICQKIEHNQIRTHLVCWATKTKPIPPNLPSNKPKVNSQYLLICQTKKQKTKVELSWFAKQQNQLNTSQFANNKLRVNKPKVDSQYLLFR